MTSSACRFGVSAQLTVDTAHSSPWSEPPLPTRLLSPPFMTQAESRGSQVAVSAPAGLPAAGLRGPGWHLPCGEGKGCPPPCTPTALLQGPRSRPSRAPGERKGPGAAGLRQPLHVVGASRVPEAGEVPGQRNPRARHPCRRGALASGACAPGPRSRFGLQGSGRAQRGFQARQPGDATRGPARVARCRRCWAAPPPRPANLARWVQHLSGSNVG